MTELDAATVICGLPKHGKTTVARELALSHLQQYPSGRVFVHDRHQQFSPDLTAPYPTPVEWRARMLAAPAKNDNVPRGASFFKCKASEVTKLAVELGEKHNTQHNVKVPMLVVYDESSLMDTSGATWMSDLDVELFSNRRHYGVHPVYNVQRPGALMEAFFSQSTEVVIFSQPSEEWTRTLETRLGLPKGTLAACIGGPKFRKVRWRMGEGIVP